jgi:hypothetical protein
MSTIVANLIVAVECLKRARPNIEQQKSSRSDPSLRLESVIRIVTHLHVFIPLAIECRHHLGLFS